MKTDLKLKMSYSGKGINRTLSAVNPAASNSTLATFGTKLASLTENTYESTDKIMTVNCDTEPDDSRTEPILQLSSSSCTLADLANNQYYTACTITTSSDGDYYVRTTSETADASVYVAVVGNTVTLTSKVGNTQAQTVYIGVLPTATYAGKEVAFTITNA